MDRGQASKNDVLLGERLGQQQYGARCWVREVRKRYTVHTIPGHTLRAVAGSLAGSVGKVGGGGWDRSPSLSISMCTYSMEFRTDAVTEPPASNVCDETRSARLFLHEEDEGRT